MSKTIEEIKALATRGVGFGSNKSTVELSPEDLASIEKASAKKESVEEENVIPVATSSATKEQPPEGEKSMDMDAVKALISEAIATSNQSHKDELEELKAAHALQLQEVQSSAEVKVAEASDEAKSLQSIISGLGLDKLKGESQSVKNEAPDQPMTVLGTGSNESRAFKQMAESLQGVVVVAKGGGQVLQRDTRSLDAYYRQNKEKIAGGLEAEMKAAGFLKGTAVTSAITAVADIPSLSFEFLSASIRNTHFPDLIHSQFATYALELGTRPGLVVAVPRYNDITRPQSFADRVLATGTRLDTTGRAQDELNVLVTLLELGLGKDATNTTIGLSTFVSSYSLNNLEQVIVDKLGRDFKITKDMGLSEQWFATDRVIYNDGGLVTTTPTEVDTGDDGTMTQNFLIQLRAYMKKAEVPTFDDGCYGLAMNPNASAQFMISKSSKERDDAMAGRDLVGQMLANSTGNAYGGENPGYLGKYDGFHMYEQNMYGIGVDGDTGTQNVTLGSGPGSTLTDSSFAFGPRTIAWAEGLPTEIRMSNDDDFQREQLMTWYAHAAPAGINVKNVTSTGEQMRVVEVRTTRSAV